MFRKPTNAPTLSSSCALLRESSHWEFRFVVESWAWLCGLTTAAYTGFVDTTVRRDFLKIAGFGVAGATMASAPVAIDSEAKPTHARHTGGSLDVHAFGAKGDGKSIDTPSINRAIE